MIHAGEIFTIQVLIAPVPTICNVSCSLVFFEYLIQSVEEDVRVVRLEDERRTHAHCVISASGRIDTCQSNRTRVNQTGTYLNQTGTDVNQTGHMYVNQTGTHVNQTGHMSIKQEENMSIKQHTRKSNRTCTQEGTHLNQTGTLSIKQEHMSIKQDTC